MTDHVFHAIASNVAIAAAMSAVVLIVGRLWRNPQLVHALWVLVLLKLVTPPFLQVPVPGTVFGEPDAAAAPVSAREMEVPAFAFEPFSASEGIRSSEPIPAAFDSHRETTAQPAFSIASPLSDRVRDWLQVHGRKAASTLWIVGVLACLGLLVWQCLRFRRVLAVCERPDDEVLATARRLARKLGLKNCPPVRVVGTNIPPLVWSLGAKPVILLPSGLLRDLTLVEREAVIAHELAHVRRRDHLVRWLEAVALSVFWWNPVAWLARRKLREAEEECCDAWVVWLLPDHRRSYGKALLKTIETLDASPGVPVPAGSALGGSFYKTRIHNIMKTNPKRKMNRMAAAVVALLAVGVLPLLAQQEKTESRETEKTFPAVAPASVELMSAGELVTGSEKASGSGEGYGAENPLPTDLAGESARPDEPGNPMWIERAEPREPLAVLEGTLHDAKGETVAGQTVWVVGSEDGDMVLYQDMVTSSDGIFNFYKLPAVKPLQLYFPPDGERKASVMGPLTLDPGQLHQIVVCFQKGGVELFSAFDSKSGGDPFNSGFGMSSGEGGAKSTGDPFNSGYEAPMVSYPGAITEASPNAEPTEATPGVAAKPADTDHNQGGRVARGKSGAGFVAKTLDIDNNQGGRVARGKSGAGSAAETPDIDSNQAARRALAERIQVLEEIANLQFEEYKRGESSANDMLSARRQLADARLELARTAQERIKILAELRAFSRDVEHLAEAQLERDGSKATPQDALKAKAFRLQIEAQLAEISESEVRFH